MNEQTDKKELLKKIAENMGGLGYVDSCDCWIHETKDEFKTRGAWWRPFDSDSDSFEIAFFFGIDLIYSPERVGAINTKKTKVFYADVSDTTRLQDPIFAKSAIRKLIVRAAYGSCE